MCLHLNRFCPIECGADQSVHAGGSIFGDVFFCEVSGGNYGAVGICCLYLFHCCCQCVRLHLEKLNGIYADRQTAESRFCGSGFHKDFLFTEVAFLLGIPFQKNVQTAHAGDMGFVDQDSFRQAHAVRNHAAGNHCLGDQCFCTGEMCPCRSQGNGRGNFLYPIEHVSGFGGNAGTVGKQGLTDLPRTVQVTDAALCGEEQLAGSDLCAGGEGIGGGKS